MLNGVFGIILNQDNQVLLVLRDDMPLWNLPGGQVESGETFEQALIREIKEEIDVNIEIVDHIGTYKKNDNNIKVRTYLCSIKQGIPEIKEEGIYLEYFNLKDLPKNISNKVIMRLRDLANFNGKIINRVEFGKNCIEVLESLDKKEIYGLEKWINHPLVIKKRQRGELRLDIKFT